MDPSLFSLSFARPMHRAATLGVLLLAALLVGACDSGGENDVASISGTWRGTVDRQGTSFVVVLSLRQFQSGQAADVVRGSGNIQADTETFNFSINSGTFAPSSNSITLPQQYEGGRTGQIRGAVGEDRETMTVMLFGGPVSFNGEEVTLNKDG